MGSKRVFLCHSSVDKPVVRQLYGRLLADGFRPWLDAEDLLPGQDWQHEIHKAIRASDVVIVCLSGESIERTGFVQKEIRLALDAADERPEGSIFVIPARLEPCQIPSRLSRWHWVELYEEDGYRKLRRAIEATPLRPNDPANEPDAPEEPFTNGLYVADGDGTYWKYLRFMGDGTACCVSSTGNTQQVARWLFPDASNNGIAKYHITGTSITIRDTSPTGVVEYNGTISTDATELRLHSHSYINGHESFGIWRFDPLND